MELGKTTSIIIIMGDDEEDAIGISLGSSRVAAGQVRKLTFS